MSQLSKNSWRSLFLWHHKRELLMGVVRWITAPACTFEVNQWGGTSLSPRQEPAGRRTASTGRPPLHLIRPCDGQEVATCVWAPVPTAVEGINPEPLQSNLCVGTATQQGGNATESIFWKKKKKKALFMQRKEKKWTRKARVVWGRFRLSHCE